MKSKDKLQLNIKKALGTLTKIQKMIDNDDYCADIAHQINASIGLLQSANRDLLKHHLAHCGAHKLNQEGKEKDDFIDELLRNWDIVVRK